MNSRRMNFNSGLQTLRSMFPLLDEEIIIAVLEQTGILTKY